MEIPGGAAIAKAFCSLMCASAIWCNAGAADITMDLSGRL